MIKFNSEEERKNYYKIQYKMQKEYIDQLLEPGEKIVHCLDKKSFGGKYYLPEWCVTNLGRVYSLSRKRWMSPQAVGDARAYWALMSVSGSIRIHLLVIVYFANESDKIAIEWFSEDGVDGHHINPIDIPEHLKTQTRRNRADRIKHCMECNKKSNVVFQAKEDNWADKMIIQGRMTTEERKGLVQWSKDMDDFRTLGSNCTMSDGNAFGSYYIYYKDEQGNFHKKLKMTMELKGSVDM